MNGSYEGICVEFESKKTQPWVAHFPITHKYFVFDYWAIESSSVVYIFNKGIIS